MVHQQTNTMSDSTHHFSTPIPTRSVPVPESFECRTPGPEFDINAVLTEFENDPAYTFGNGSQPFDMPPLDLSLFDADFAEYNVSTNLPSVPLNATNVPIAAGQFPPASTTDGSEHIDADTELPPFPARLLPVPASTWSATGTSRFSSAFLDLAALWLHGLRNLVARKSAVPP